MIIERHAVAALLPLFLLAACGDPGPTDAGGDGGEAVALAFLAAPEAAMAGTPVEAIEVAVKDEDGNTVASSTAITLALTPGSGAAGAVLGGTVTRNAVGGVARFDDVTVDRSGAGYTFSATAADLAGAVTSGFDVSPLVRVVAGGDQTGLAGHLLADSVIVSVEDPAGTGVAGATVAWSAATGEVSAGATTTGGDGTAPVAWRLGAGEQTLTAGHGGGAAEIEATALAVGSCALTPTDGVLNSGFPLLDTLRVRPATRTIRAAALFIDFPDLTATRTIAEMESEIIAPALEMLSATTDGVIDFAVLPHAEWVRMPENAEDLRWNDFLTHRDYIDTVLARVDADYDFSAVDVVWIFRPSRYDPQVVSGVMNLSQGDVWALPPRDGHELRNFITFGGDVHLLDVYPDFPEYGAHIVAHENGHVFGLPDLYAYEAADGDGLRYTGGWSFMGWVAPGTAWFAVERLYIDAMPDDDALCPPATPFGAIVRLAPITVSTGLRALGLRETEARIHFMEVRQSIGLDAEICASGLLAYDADADAAGGHGPVRVREGHASPAGEERDRCGPLWNAPYQVGDAIELESPDATIEVLEEGEDGSMLLRVVRRQ